MPSILLGSLQTAEGLFIPASPLRSSQAFDCAVSSSWNALPQPLTTRLALCGPQSEGSLWSFTDVVQRLLRGWPAVGLWEDGFSLSLSFSVVKWNCFEGQKGEKEDTLRNSLEWHQAHSLKKLSVGTKGTTRMAETLHLLLPGTGCWRSPQGLDSEGESVMSD